MECVRRQKSYGVMVSTPIRRPIQSLTALCGKKAPCPQSCWIMNSRTRKPAVGTAIKRHNHQAPKKCSTAHIAVHKAASGTSVIASSTRLRAPFGSR